MTRRGWFVILGCIVGAVPPGCTRRFAASEATPVAGMGRQVCQIRNVETPSPAEPPDTVSATTVTKATHGAIVFQEDNPEPQSGSQTPFTAGVLVFPRLEQPIPASTSVSILGRPGDQSALPAALANAPSASLLGPVLHEAPLLAGAGSEAQEMSPPAPVAQIHVEPLLKALECALANKPNKALDCLKKYDPTSQDFLIRLLPIMARVTQKSLEQMNPEEIGVFQEQLEGVLELLRPRSDLAIAQMCFCKPDSIKGFGIYEPLPEGHLFHAATRPGTGPGDGEGVYMYVELRNFSNEQRDLRHETRLKSWVEIRDPKEDPKNNIWDYRFPDKEVQTRARLHDFPLTYWFAVPHIPAGFYTLTIHVEDDTGPGKPRHASKSVPFQVTSLPMRNP
jgi:hypothetical protein